MGRNVKGIFANAVTPVIGYLITLRRGTRAVRQLSGAALCEELSHIDVQVQIVVVQQLLRVRGIGGGGHVCCEPL